MWTENVWTGSARVCEWVQSIPDPSHHLNVALIAISTKLLLSPHLIRAAVGGQECRHCRNAHPSKDSSSYSLSRSQWISHFCQQNKPSPGSQSKERDVFQMNDGSVSWKKKKKNPGQVTLRVGITASKFCTRQQELSHYIVVWTRF